MDFLLEAMIIFFPVNLHTGFLIWSQVDSQLNENQQKIINDEMFLQKKMKFNES